MDHEPLILVGILEGRPEIRGRFNGPFRLDQTGERRGPFRAFISDGHVALACGAETVSANGMSIRCLPSEDATFSLDDVTIGIDFHWERRETQTFSGNLVLQADGNGTLTAVNEILLEDYLTSVISSEMNPEAPPAFLEAHAVTSRSWLAAMLARHGNTAGSPGSGRKEICREDEISRWYGREDHRHFHVCADDHCQRYQGTEKMTDAAIAAVDTTRGLFLVHEDVVCDARYYKACGGLTEHFATAWEEREISYLTSVSDGAHDFPPVRTEADARKWIMARPDAYCNTADSLALRRILPAFDQETTDFFRWEVTYARETLEEILKRKSGYDFGILCDLIPLERGPSGRIVRLRITGSAKTMTVGKELEIRRWLSESHLYSSAFVVSTVRDDAGVPVSFRLNGAGWGHGVGLCQIGAAMMALQGFTAADILKHYFPAASLKHLYGMR